MILMGHQGFRSPGEGGPAAEPSRMMNGMLGPVTHTGSLWLQCVLGGREILGVGKKQKAKFVAELTMESRIKEQCAHQRL